MLVHNRAPYFVALVSYLQTISSRPVCRILLVLGFLSVAIGCRREEIRAYSIPKERASMETAAPESDGRPRLRWGSVPRGWQEQQATGMRVASFSVRGPQGQRAEVTIIPFPGTAGSEMENVNRWRGEIGLPAMATETADSAPVTIGGLPGKLFDMSSAGADPKQRTVAAMLARENSTWFFKLKGDAGTVAAEKPAFVEFLKSVSFEPSTAAVAANDARPVSTNIKKEPVAEGSTPQWTVPPGWNAQAAPMMVLHSFAISGEQGGQATISISTLPGAAGGALDNVNRWRRQLGLEPVEESGLPAMTTSIDVMGGKAMLVDMTGRDAKTGREARMLAAAVPREGKTWFYKLLGDGPVVEAQKEAFVKFVQTVRYPNG